MPKIAVPPTQDRLPFDADNDPRRGRPNPSALPMGSNALIRLLTSTTVTLELCQSLPQFAEQHTQDRAIVVETYRRLTPSERFRFHSALHAQLSYVPLWIQEVAS